MRRIITLGFLLVAALAGPAIAHEEKLAGADWVLTGVSGGRGPFLRFDGGRVGGLGGCNRFGGRYELKGDDLTFSPLMTTRMACRPDMMKAEQAFFDMLGKVKAIRLEGDRLELLDGKGTVLGRFARRVAE
jgi:heat shock protein HslJ